MAQATVSRKLLRRFYEPLLLLSALGQIRGQRIKPESDANSISPNIQKLRRSFVDGIAYICAYEKVRVALLPLPLNRPHKAYWSGSRPTKISKRKSSSSLKKFCPTSNVLQSWMTGKVPATTNRITAVLKSFGAAVQNRT